MARDRGLEELLAEDLAAAGATLTARALFGGLVWFHESRMVCGARHDGLLFRLGAGRDAWALAMTGVRAMHVGARPMPGWIWASEAAVADDTLRRRLLDAALAFARTAPRHPQPLAAVPWDFPDAPEGSPARRSRATASQA